MIKIIAFTDEKLLKKQIVKYFNKVIKQLSV